MNVNRSCLRGFTFRSQFDMWRRLPCLKFIGGSPPSGPLGKRKPFIEKMSKVTSPPFESLLFRRRDVQKGDCQTLAKAEQAPDNGCPPKGASPPAISPPTGGSFVHKGFLAFASPCAGRFFEKTWFEKGAIHTFLETRFQEGRWTSHLGNVAPTNQFEGGERFSFHKATDPQRFVDKPPWTRNAKRKNPRPKRGDFEQPEGKYRGGSSQNPSPS
ncbi:hypothetical protein RRG08_003311 [Elysia crispata]|uniref:Uncharacterized protein n=1 Tax=Elysia crispata TaxID=231223 RepID=A0AAE1DKT7_9GAST|nr:hypothetical protein RRG08_003311 [Elysia crispata]